LNWKINFERELRRSLQSSQKRLSSGDASMQPFKARTCSHKHLRNVGNRLDAKQEGIHRLEALQESAKITADPTQADHQAKIEELRQALAAEGEKMSKLEMENDWICTDGERLQEDL
jgi:hypothetical protein